MQRKVYSAIAGAVRARENCQNGKNPEWYAKHKDRAEQLTREFLPSGSGFDSGTKLDWDRTTAERLVFTTAFHHMDEHGYYSGWSEHTVTVRASLVFGFTLSVSGRDRNGIKDYIAETFHCALCAVVPE